MSLLSMLRTTATQQRATKTKDASGGQVMTFADIAGSTDVPCDIQPASGNVQVRYMQQNKVVTHTMYFSERLTVLAGDRFATSDGRYLHFQGMKPAAPGYTQWPTVVDVEEK